MNRGWSQRANKKLKKSRGLMQRWIIATRKVVTRSRRSSFIMMMISFLTKIYKRGLKGSDLSLFNSSCKIFLELLKLLHLIVSWIRLAYSMISLQNLMNLFSQIRLKNLLLLLQITNFINSILKIRMFCTRRIMMEWFQSVGLILILQIHILCFKHIFHNLSW